MARNLAIPVLFFFFAAGLVQASEPIKIFVFPLEGTSEEKSLSWLNEGIAYSVSQQLESRGVDVISRKERATVVENLDLPPGAQISHASMIRAAQRASADLLIMGTFSGTRLNLKISLKTLELKTMSLSGDIVANGSVANLPQLENELAWMVLNNAGLAKTATREKFQLKMRKTPNLAYALFIESFSASKENERISLLLKAVESNRDFPDALLELSAIYFRKGNCGTAMPFLKRIQSAGSPSQDCEFMMGSCYLQEDLTEQAVQSLSHALINSRYYEALNNLAVAYLRKGDYGLALNSLLEAKGLAHGDSTVALNTAIVRHLQGNDWAAKNSLDEAVKAHPRDGMLHFLLGILLQSHGEREKAATAFNKAKLLGIVVEKLQTQAPRSWARLIFDRQSS
jgi:Flp pilus assembly protein TadD